MKEFAGNNFNFDENGTKFFKWVENTVGKGEIACYEQISFFPTVFSNGLYSRYIKSRACLGKDEVNYQLVKEHKQNIKLVIHRLEKIVGKEKKQEGHDGPEIAHLSLLTKHAPSSFPVT